MNRPTVRDTMELDTHAVSPDLAISDAISLLIEEGLTGVPVVDEKGSVLGVLSEEHCLELLAKGDASSQLPRGRVAAHHDPTVPRVTPDMDIYYVGGMFLRERRHRRFPVVENGKLVGVITRKDILKVLIRNLNTA